MFEQKL